MFAGKLYISPRYNPENYTSLNLRLNSPTSDWNSAIDIFEDRIYGRFLYAIEKLLKETRDFPTDSIDFSFSIMAIMCPLIETMHQFYNGLKETVGAHEDAFVNFFINSRYFSPYFNVSLGKIFYSHIRCGILHQAQTKKNSQLTINSGIMVERAGNGIRVDIIRFYEAIKDEVHDYISRLHNTDEQELRENFIEKMRYIVNSEL